MSVLVWVVMVMDAPAIRSNVGNQIVLAFAAVIVFGFFLLAIFYLFVSAGEAYRVTINNGEIVVYVHFRKPIVFLVGKKFSRFNVGCVTLKPRFELIQSSLLISGSKWFSVSKNMQGHDSLIEELTVKT